MDTFNPPGNEFITHGLRSTISDSKSPNSKLGSLYIQKEAFEQNHAAERFIQELDASAKKQFIQKEQELNQFMTRGSFGLSIERDYGINESIQRGNQPIGMGNRIGERLISSYGSSKRDFNNQPYSPNIGGIQQEETISRYLVDRRNIDSQSRGNDTILRIKTQSPSPMKSSYNAEKGSYERSSKYDTNQYIPTFVNQSIYCSNQNPQNEKNIQEQQYYTKTTSQQELRNFNSLCVNENKNIQNINDNQQFMKKVQSNQALHYQQKRNFEKEINYFNQNQDIQEQEPVNYTTNNRDTRNLINITDQMQNYQNLRQPSNEKIQKYTQISMSQKNLFNQHPYDEYKSRNDIVNNLRSTPQINSHSDNPLFNNNNLQQNQNSIDANHQFSQEMNSSTTLNRRIEKLKNDIHLNNQQLISPSQHDKNLTAQLARAQDNSNHLISKSRSRSPLSASELSQLYVETKRTRSNATSLQIQAHSEIQKTQTTFRSQSKTKSQQANDTKQSISYINNTNQTLQNVPTVKDQINQNNISQKQMHTVNDIPQNHLFQGSENNQQVNKINNIFTKVNQQSTKSLKKQLSQRNSSQNETRIVSINQINKRFDSALQQKRQEIKGRSSSLRTRNPFQMNNTTDRSLIKIPVNHQKGARTLSKKSNQKIFVSQGQLQKEQIESINPISQKQVNFQDKYKSTSNLQNLGTFPTSLLDNSEQNQINLDIFYQDIIKKERLEFKQILKSQTIIARSDAEAKFRKYIDGANQKYKKINELERNLKFIKNNNEKLRGDWQKIQIQFQQSQRQLSQIREENQILKSKLDNLWQKLEDDKDLVKQVTRIEVEKEMDIRNKELEEQIIQTQKNYEDILRKCENLQILEIKLKESENERLNQIQLREQLQTNFEKIEVENQKLKIELANSQAAQMANLKNKYNEMKQKYKELEQQSKESSRDQQNLQDTNFNSDIQVDDEKKTQLKNQASYRIQNEGGSDVNNSIDSNIQDLYQNKYIKLKRKSSKQKKKTNIDRSHSPKAHNQYKDDKWRQRCQILADKYFNIIKDMKKSIQKLKTNNLNQIEQLKIELAQSFTFQLNKFIEEKQRNKNQIQIDNKNENIQMVKQQVSSNEIRKHEVDKTFQRSSQPTPGFQSREDLSSQLYSINERLLNKNNITQNNSSTNLIQNNQKFVGESDRILVENENVYDRLSQNNEMLGTGLLTSENMQNTQNNFINHQGFKEQKDKFYHFDLDQNLHDRVKSSSYISNFGKHFYRNNEQKRTASNSLNANEQLQPYGHPQRNDNSSSHSNSRVRTIAQVAVINGSQHFIASLRNKGNSQYENNTLPSKRLAHNQISSSYNSNQVALSNQRSHASQISVSQSIGGYAIGNQKFQQTQNQQQILISPNSKAGSSYQKERQLSNQYFGSDQNESNTLQNYKKNCFQPPQSIHQLYPINSETFSEVNKEIDVIKNIGSSIMSTLNQDQPFNQTYQDQNMKSSNNQVENLLPNKQQHYISFQKKQSTDQKNQDLMNLQDKDKQQIVNKQQNKNQIKEIKKQKYIKRSSSQKLLDLQRAAQKQKDELSKSDKQNSKKSAAKRSLTEMTIKKQTDEKKSFTSSNKIQKSNVSIELSKSKQRQQNKNSKVIKNLYGKRQSSLNKSAKSIKSKLSRSKQGAQSSKGSMSSKSRSFKKSENSFIKNQSQIIGGLSTIVEIQGNQNNGHIFKQPDTKQINYNESERYTEKQAYDSMRINKKSILQSADLQPKDFSGLKTSHVYSNKEHIRTNNQISEFEKLNAEIQKSINSLKKLSEKQAYTGCIDIDEVNAGYTSQTNSVPNKIDSFSNNKTYISQSSNQNKFTQNNFSKISHY